MHVARVGIMRNERECLVGKPEGKSQVGRTKSRWQDIKAIRTETGQEVVDWIDMAQDSDQYRVLVNMIINFLVP